MYMTRSELEHLNSLEPQAILRHIQQTGISPIYIQDHIVQDWIVHGSKYEFCHYLGYGDYIKWQKLKEQK